MKKSSLKMNLLVVAATPFEIKPLVDYLDIKMVNYPQVFVSDFRQSKVTVLITGVGMVNTAFQLGKLLAGRRFDLAINLGIAGSFNPGIRIGEVVNVVSEQFADFGAQDGDDFLDMFEMKLMG